MLVAENSQKVLYFRNCHISYRQIGALFFFAMDAAAEAFFKAPFFLGGPPN